ncbi:FxsA family protein [bacterium]|nr:FxsA family protein [bacterium]
MPWLLLLFVVLPAVEIYLLIQLGQLIGGLQTFGLILATGLLGSYMAKKQGLAVWTELNKKLASGQMPGTELIDGAIILVSATLLVTPGVVTDVIGFMGLFPNTRTLIRIFAQTFINGKSGISVNIGAFGGSHGYSSASSGQHSNTPDGQTAPPSPQYSSSSKQESGDAASLKKPPVELSGKAKSRPSFDH